MKKIALFLIVFAGFFSVNANAEESINVIKSGSGGQAQVVTTYSQTVTVAQLQAQIAQLQNQEANLPQVKNINKRIADIQALIAQLNSSGVS